MCSSCSKRVEHVGFAKDDGVTDLPVSTIRLSGQGQNVSVRIRRTLTLRRRAADTDTRKILDVLVVHRGAFVLRKHISLVAFTVAPNESIGALQVFLKEVEDTLPGQAARDRESHRAIAHSNDGSNGCGSDGQGQEKSRQERRSEHLWTRGGAGDLVTGSRFYIPCKAYRQRLGQVGDARLHMPHTRHLVQYRTGHLKKRRNSGNLRRHDDLILAEKHALSTKDSERWRLGCCRPQEFWLNLKFDNRKETKYARFSGVGVSHDL